MPGNAVIILVFVSIPSNIPEKGITTPSITFADDTGDQTYNISVISNNNNNNGFNFHSEMNIKLYVTGTIQYEI